MGHVPLKELTFVYVAQGEGVVLMLTIFVLFEKGNGWLHLIL